MTQNVIEELRGLYEAGTKGPWLHCGVHDDWIRADIGDPNGFKIIARLYYEGNKSSEKDARLIAAMHRHLPTLLAALDKCHQALLVCSHQEPDNCACCGWNHARGHAKTCEVGIALETLSRLTAQGTTP